MSATSARDSGEDAADGDDGGRKRLSAPSLAEAARVWARIGLLSFGGPAGQIALMHNELVEKRRWISEPRFLHALNYCMLLPGPEAQQLTIYVGWLLHRTWGGLIAGLLFVLPGFVAILGLSLLYVAYGTLPVVGALFLGLKAAILAIVAQALWRIGVKTLAGPPAMAVALGAFVAILALSVPFPVIILGAALCGLLWQHSFVPRARAVQPLATTAAGVVDELLAQGDMAHMRPSLLRTLRTAGLWLLIWWLPVLAILAWLGAGSVLGQQGVFFSQTAVVAFGGAYAVLAYVAQRMVDGFAWITPGEMVDGLALAESTPGPLIMVLQFVAFIAAFKHETGLSPLAAGLLASLLATWVTFAPCFLWIFVGAPYVERLRSHRALNSALTAVTAAVVGVIANLAVWFALHVLFGELGTHSWGPLHLELPVLTSLDPIAFALAAFAFVLMFVFRLGLLRTLLLCAAAGAALHLATA